MKIAVYGATGAIGSTIVTEAVSRGHDVTRISRGVSTGDADLTGDAHDPAFTGPIAEKHDVVVSAVGPSRLADDGNRFADTIANLAGTLGFARLLVVGGAGTLSIDGVRLIDTPGFPEEYKAEALKGAASLQVLRETGAEVDWTYLSPAPVIAPGERTGTYKVGLESPVGDHVSIENYAVALVDEIETPAHVRQRFTVAD
ncbi:MAG TPA: NAD(P)H-binding protein [Marmoricola sp.]|jgi:hypothetical protein|nr:NAD(P)H-binding protein [Marmoricola sp.]